MKTKKVRFKDIKLDEEFYYNGLPFVKTAEHIGASEKAIERVIRFTDESEVEQKYDDDFEYKEEEFNEFYDLEQVFDEKIHPLLKTIINICNEYDIPMVTTFQYKNEEDLTHLCTSAVLPKARTGDKVKNAAMALLH